MLHFPEIVFKPLKYLLPGDSIFLVGGAIRDTLINRPIKDIDFVVNRDPREIARKLADELSASYYVLDEERNTCRVLVDQHSKNNLIFDFAQIRGESIVEDIMQRDFTINAMAADLSQPGVIIDPCRGEEDLKHKFLRPVSSTAFIDDPIRTIRAVRYAVNLGLKIEKDTNNLIRLAVDKLDWVSVERKRDELFKILDGSKIGTAINLLTYYGIFSMIRLESSRDFDFAARRAQLLDDFIRIACKHDDLEKQTSFIRNSLFLQFSQFSGFLFEHFYYEEPTGRIHKSLIQFVSLFEGEAVDRLENFALSTEEIKIARCILSNQDLVSNLVDQDFPITTREIYKYFKETEEAGIDLVFLTLANYATRVGIEFSRDFWLKLLNVGASLLEAWFGQPQVVNPKPLLNGNDLMFRFDLIPGPLIGELLEEMKEEQAAGTLTTIQDALDWVDQRLLRIKI